MADTNTEHGIVGNAEDLNRPILEQYDIFLSRRDVIAVKTNGRIFPARVVLISDLLEGHTTGREINVLERCKNKKYILHTSCVVRCGVYTLNTDNTTRYACIDLDGEGHVEFLENPHEYAVKIQDNFAKQSCPSYVEKSFSGTGYHVWIFFEEPIEASYARQLCTLIIPPELLGERKVEIFPKQEKIKPDGFGNFVFLPNSAIAKGEGTTRLDLTSVTLIPRQHVLNVIKNLMQQDDNNVKTQESSPATINPTTGLSKEDDTIWSIWRRKVLASLDLSLIYGKYLTGKTNGEWLECRDPWSQSGDSRPSAGVSTGNKGGSEAATTATTTTTAKGTWHSFITGETLSVFDFLRKSKVVKDDHIEACKYVAALTGCEMPSTFLASEKTLPANYAERDLYPNIVVNLRQHRDIVSDCWASIEEHNLQDGGPFVFLKSDHLTTISGNSLNILSDTQVHGLLSRIGNWVRHTAAGYQNVMPITSITKDVAVCDHEVRGRIPKIEMVINTPIFSKSRQLVCKDGYNESAQVYLRLSEDLRKLGEIPKQPTDSDIEFAKDVIMGEMLVNFPFVSKSDVAHTFCAMLLPFVRQLIDGPTPLHVVEAPAPGTGKSKLCNLASIAAVGSLCKATSLPSTDEEIRKMLTSELSVAKPVVLLDNAPEKKKLDSASLAALLTSVDWSDRILGETRMTELKNHALWFLTANNPQLSMELARRSIRIRLDAKLDQPWRRKEFKHPYIEEWAIENRTLIVKSLLIMVQRWIALSCPLSDNKLGSFERWSAVMGGILQANKIEGFLGNLEELYEASDVDGNEWRMFVIRWYTDHGAEETHVSKLAEICEEYGLMSRVMGTGSLRFKLARLQEAIRSARERIISLLKINISKTKANTFYLTKDEAQECKLEKEMAV